MVYDLNTGKRITDRAQRVREINERLYILRSERDDRMRRGVPLPPELTEAMDVLEAALESPDNSEEAFLVDMDLSEQDAEYDTMPWWGWFLIAAAVLALVAVIVRVSP
jgi:hypothetical protein